MIRNFLKKKGPGFYADVALILCLLLSLIFFLVLIEESFETSETPSAVIVMIVLAVIGSIVVCYRDFFHAVSLVSFIAATSAFFTFVRGRVSYFAFYISGDVMDTGLSAFFILSAVFLLLSVVLSAVTMCLKQEKSYLNFKEEI